MKKLLLITLLTFFTRGIHAAQVTPDYFTSIVTQVQDPDHLIHNPIDIAIDHDGKYGYVIHTKNDPDLIETGEGDNASEMFLYDQISVIDLQKNNVLKTIPNLMNNPTIESSDTDLDNDSAISYLALAIRPDGKYAYATSMENDSVYVIDLTNWTITHQITDKDLVAPYKILLSTDDKYAYVFNQKFSEGAHPALSVSTIDLAQNRVTKTVTLDSQFYYISNPIISKQSPYIYIAALDKQTKKEVTLFSLHLSTNAITKIVSFDYGNELSEWSRMSLAIAPNDKNLFLAYGGIRKIDLATKTVTTFLSDYFSSPFMLSIKPDNTVMYAFNHDSVDTISLQNNTLIEKAKLNNCHAAALAPDYKKAYVVNYEDIKCIVFPSLTPEKVFAFEAPLLELVKTKKILAFDPHGKMTMHTILQSQRFIDGLAKIYLTGDEQDQLQQILSDSKNALVLYDQADDAHKRKQGAQALELYQKFLDNPQAHNFPTEYANTQKMLAAPQPDYFKPIVTPVTDPKELLNNATYVKVSAVSPDGKYAYLIWGKEEVILNEDDERIAITRKNRISIIDTKTNTLIKTIMPLDNNDDVEYRDVAISSDGTLACVTSMSDIVYLLDLQKNQFTRKIQSEFFDDTSYIAITPDKKYLYLVGGKSSKSSIAIIDLRAPEAVKTVQGTRFVATGPLLVSRDGLHAYTIASKADPAQTVLCEINLQDHSFAQTAIQSSNSINPEYVSAMALSYDNKYMYAAHDGYLLKIDLNTAKAEKLTDGLWRVRALATSRDDNFLHLIYSGGIGTFNIDRTQKHTEPPTWERDNSAWVSSIITPDGRKAYAVDQNNKIVYVTFPSLAGANLQERALMALFKSKKVFELKPDSMQMRIVASQPQWFIDGLSNLYLSTEEKEKLNKMQAIHAAKARERETMKALSEESSAGLKGLAKPQARNPYVVERTAIRPAA